MPPLLAHSARPKLGIKEQLYSVHISEVERKAVGNAEAAVHYARTAGGAAFVEIVADAARFHDLGKLDSENQACLSSGGKGRLPRKHEDAGVKCLLDRGEREAALLVASHHAGIPNLRDEDAKLQYRLRPLPQQSDIAAHTDRYLPEYLKKHLELAPDHAQAGRSEKWNKRGLWRRLALSCLVDADHSNTAQNYKREWDTVPAESFWEKRAEALDRYIRDLNTDDQDPERTRMRRAVYDACRQNPDDSGLLSCDSAVGTGKTTAIMAYLLRLAKERRLRHIFVVLPYINVIKQSVDVYRKALVLDGETAERVVAAHHHQADFENPELRQLATLWDCPITVTTAVQFFETLGSNRPSRLRKLHELPGSAILIDEAHAAIPVWMWRQSWEWITELARDWSCHFVFASGSLPRFWTLNAVVQQPSEIPDLLPLDLRGVGSRYELERVKIDRVEGTLGLEPLIDRLSESRLPGPRLVIVNTVQSAAVLANAMHLKDLDVMHLSTALTPHDRDQIIERVGKRLKDGNDSDWTLVATSCIESGVDFSFRNGVRESCSTASLLQIAGRINRHGEWMGAILLDVRIEGEFWKANRSFRESRQVLEAMFEREEIGRTPLDALMTKAIEWELKLDRDERAETLLKRENQENYPEVANLCKVIADRTLTVIVDKEIAARIEKGERIRPEEWLPFSVHIYTYREKELALAPICGHDELYRWTLSYDPKLLGYMAGVLPLLKIMRGDLLEG